MKELRITLRVRNNRLVQLREDLGLSQRALAEKIGSTATLLSGLETMRINPIGTRGGWRLPAVKLSDFYGVSCAELFSQAVRDIKNPVAERRIDAEELPSLLGQHSHQLAESVDQAWDQKELETQTRRVLATLTSQEEKVVRDLYFKDKSTVDTAETVGLSRARIHQIKTKALRKLRHPSRSRQLKPFVVTSRSRSDKGLIFRRQSQETGTLRGLYSETDDGPWETYCEDHNRSAYFDIQQDAEMNLMSSDWCEPCQEEKEKADELDPLKQVEVFDPLKQVEVFEQKKQSQKQRRISWQESLQFIKNKGPYYLRPVAHDLPELFRVGLVAWSEFNQPKLTEAGRVLLRDYELSVTEDQPKKDKPKKDQLNNDDFPAAGQIWKNSSTPVRFLILSVDLISGEAHRFFLTTGRQSRCPIEYLLNRCDLVGHETISALYPTENWVDDLRVASNWTANWHHEFLVSAKKYLSAKYLYTTSDTTVQVTAKTIIAYWRAAKELRQKKESGGQLPTESLKLRRKKRRKKRRSTQLLTWWAEARIRLSNRREEEDEEWGAGWDDDEDDIDDEPPKKKRKK